MPTECARLAILGRLASLTGREVYLSQVRVGVCGGVYLSDLRIASPRPGGEPWLRVNEAAINVNLWHLLCGSVEPSQVEVQGLFLRVLRRRDGSVELADLVKPDRDADPAMVRSGECKPDFEVLVHDATVQILDEANEMRLELSELEGRGTVVGPVASVSDLTGRLGGGTVRIAAQFDRSGSAPRFEGDFRFQGVALGEGIGPLTYLVPLVASTQNNSEGRLGLNLTLRGRGLSLEEIRRTVTGRGWLRLDPVVLNQSTLLSDLTRLAGVPAGDRVGSIRATLVVGDGRLATNDLTVEMARVPVMFAGWTDFDGKVDYRVHTVGLGKRLSPRTREFLSGLGVGNDTLDGVRLSGSVTAPVLTVEGVPINAPAGEVPGQSIGERERLLEASRRLRGRVRR
jgi:AsmA protein